MTSISIFIALAISFATVAQDQKTNQFDANGKRHGLWQKTYDGQEQLRYQGTFEHGQEVGIFKHYKPRYGKQPSAVLEYKPKSDLIEVRYFKKNGELISKGQLKNRERTGVWEYYHSNSTAVMMTETYENDKLNGEKITYYDNGQVTEEVTYQNGNKQGDYKSYSLKGVLLKDFNYENDELHGKAIYYNGKGEKIIEGQYKRGRKDGVWTYFESGEVTSEKTFPVDFTDADAVKG